MRKLFRWLGNWLIGRICPPAVLFSGLSDDEDDGSRESAKEKKPQKGEVIDFDEAYHMKKGTGKRLMGYFDRGRRGKGNGPRDDGGSHGLMA